MRACVTSSFLSPDGLSPRPSIPAGDIGMAEPPTPRAVGLFRSAAFSTPARPVGRPPLSGSNVLAGEVKLVRLAALELSPPTPPTPAPIPPAAAPHPPGRAPPGAANGSPHPLQPRGFRRSRPRIRPGEHAHHALERA